MTTLTLVGVENDTLVLVSEDGQRFFVEINEALRDALRQRSGADSTAHRVSPKDIQAHIRRGLTAQQVADLTGEEVTYIEKFEGAVIAERNFIVDQALAVSVTTRSGDETTFGQSIRERLEEISASGEKWSAWKEETGWLIELTFAEGDVEHSARWTFHQRKHVLEPLNEDATVLSRHEPMPTTLIPKLSAVATAETETEPDRFDSEIFESSDLGETGPFWSPCHMAVRRTRAAWLTPLICWKPCVASVENASLPPVLRRAPGAPIPQREGFDWWTTRPPMLRLRRLGAHTLPMMMTQNQPRPKRSARKCPAGTTSFLAREATTTRPRPTPPEE